MLNLTVLRTFIQTRQVIFEEHQGWEPGNAKLFGGAVFTYFDKMDTTFGAIVIYLLHDFQKILSFPWVHIVYKMQWQLETTVSSK